MQSSFKLSVNVYISYWKKTFLVYISTISKSLNHGLHHEHRGMWRFCRHSIIYFKHSSFITCHSSWAHCLLKSITLRLSHSIQLRALISSCSSYCRFLRRCQHKHFDTSFMSHRLALPGDKNIVESVKVWTSFIIHIPPVLGFCLGSCPFLTESHITERTIFLQILGLISVFAPPSVQSHGIHGGVWRISLQAKITKDPLSWQCTSFLIACQQELFSVLPHTKAVQCRPKDSTKISGLS